jgi:Tol biopolymer transport system component
MGFTGERVARAALLAATLLLSIAPSAGATFPGENGRIAFTDSGSVYTIDPDGTDRTFVVANAHSPAWSADGRRLAYFINQPDANRGLHVANADGSGHAMVRHAEVSRTQTSSTEETFFEPAWSPDGGTIAYEEIEVACSHPACIIRPMGIRAIRPDGSGDRLLHLPGFPAANPAYSPDGSLLAWDAEGVHVSNSDGTADIVLGPGFDPSWSPDGTRIAFARYVDSFNVEIHVMNADGNEERRLTFQSGDDRDPVWSPDGTKIAWAAQSGLSVMNADGSEPTTLAAGVLPDWQPLVGPRRAHYKNASHFCKAAREFMGSEQFTQRYGNHGGCISQNR